MNNAATVTLVLCFAFDVELVVHEQTPLTLGFAIFGAGCLLFNLLCTRATARLVAGRKGQR